MEKYPSKFHLTFSPEVHRDDKIIRKEYLSNFVNREVVITEKIDGQNQTFKGKNGVFARSHQMETQLPWDFFVKSYYYNNIELMKEKVWYVFENVFAIHSIEYTELNSFMYMFATFFEEDNQWGSWDEVVENAKSINIPTVPVLFEGKFNSMKDIQLWMEDEINKPSLLGGDREGFVIRVRERINENDYDKKIAKFVRKGHVQTDEHWTKNWKKASLKKSK